MTAPEELGGFGVFWFGFRSLTETQAGDVAKKNRTQKPQTRWNWRPAIPPKGALCPEIIWLKQSLGLRS